MFGKRGKITWSNDASCVKARTTKNNPMDKHVRMIDPAGFVVQVSLATGRGIPVVQNLYGPMILQEKKNKGFVEYDSFTSDKKREEFIAERKAAHTAKQAAYAEQTITEGQAMARAVEKMADLASQNGGTSGKG